MIKWLEKETEGINVLFLTTGTVLWMLVYICLILYISTGNILPKQQTSASMPILEYSFPLKLFIMAYIEEFIFRLPLGVFCFFVHSKKIILAIACVISIFFGILHGGAIHILCQGVFGIILSIVFLKTGGINKKIIKPLFFSTVTHFLYNGAIAIMIILNGGTMF